jgi:hypothetical protein
MDYLLMTDQHCWTKLPRCLQNFTNVLPLREKLSNTEFLIRTQFHGVHAWTTYVNMGKDKAVPLQAWSGPEGSRKLRFPDFMTTQDGGKVASLTHRPPLAPGYTPGTHFC